MKTVAQRLSLARVLDYFQLVVDRWPSQHETEIIHLAGVDRRALLIFQTKSHHRIAARLAAFDFHDIENHARELTPVSRKSMRATDRRAKLRAVRLMAIDTSAFGRRSRTVMFSRLEINVVVTRHTTHARR